MRQERKTRPALWTLVPSAARKIAAEREAKESAKAERRRERRRNQRCRGHNGRSAIYAEAMAEYARRAAAFVAAAAALEETCPVVALVPELRNGRKYGWPISSRIVEVHHFAGRGRGGRGPLLLDERLWIAVSKQGHRFIHAHPDWARANGFMVAPGRWNVPVPAGVEIIKTENGGLLLTQKAVNSNLLT